VTYQTRTYESNSTANLFVTANRMVALGWQAFAFETKVTGWIFNRYLYRITFRRRLPPPRPGVVSIRVAAEDETMLTFVVSLPAQTPEEFDVVSRKTEVTIGGVALEPQVTPVATTEIGPFQGQQGDTVTIKCWNVDDAGNVSETASLFEDTLLDTFAPPAPGLLGIRVTGEEPDPVVPPVEEPVPPVEEPAPPIDPVV